MEFFLINFKCKISFEFEKFHLKFWDVIYAICKKFNFILSILIKMHNRSKLLTKKDKYLFRIKRN